MYYTSKIENIYKKSKNFFLSKVNSVCILVSFRNVRKKLINLYKLSLTDSKGFFDYYCIDCNFIKNGDLIEIKNYKSIFYRNLLKSIGKTPRTLKIEDSSINPGQRADKNRCLVKYSNKSV